MKFPITFLITLSALAASNPNSASGCDLKKLLEKSVRENLNVNFAFDEIVQLKQQADGSYFVEFTYIGSDFQDSGFFVFSVDTRSCVAKRR